MTKKAVKISVLICALALVFTVMFALSACGEKGTEYKYSATKVELIGDLGGDEGGIGGNLNTVYETMYKNSSIVVSDSKVVWKFSDTESVLSVKKDGNKYVLSGEYAEQMKKVLSSGLSVGADVQVSFDMYGNEIENGFEIVMSVTYTISVSGSNQTYGTKITVNFEK